MQWFELEWLERLASWKSMSYRETQAGVPMPALSLGNM
jgi:hypothetical protein